MSTRRYATTLLLLLLGSPGSALAEGGTAAAPSPGPPRPSKDLEAFMSPLVGSWKCPGKFAAGALGPGSLAVNAFSSVKFKKDYDGFIYRGEVETKKQKGVETPMKDEIMLAWDPAAKQVLIWHFNSTGAVIMARGKPQGDTLVTLGEVFTMGVKIETRETHILKGDKEHYHKLEIDMGKGWMPVVEGSCTK